MKKDNTDFDLSTLWAELNEEANDNKLKEVEEDNVEIKFDELESKDSDSEKKTSLNFSNTIENNEASLVSDNSTNSDWSTSDFDFSDLSSELEDWPSKDVENALEIVDDVSNNKEKNDGLVEEDNSNFDDKTNDDLSVTENDLLSNSIDESFKSLEDWSDEWKSDAELWFVNELTEDSSFDVLKDSKSEDNVNNDLLSDSVVWNKLNNSEGEKTLKKLDFSEIFKWWFKKTIRRWIRFLKRNFRYVFYWLSWIAWFIFVVFLIVLFLTNSSYKKLNNSYDMLNYVEAEDLRNISVNQRFWTLASQVSRNSDLIEFHKYLNEEKAYLDGVYNTLLAPYERFLTNIYLPSINIWKDPYSWDLTKELIWQRYMDDNPFLDTNIIMYWSSYFTTVGEDFPDNEVLNIRIWDVANASNGLFYIPITVDFKAPDRRNFLMLIDKLSMTSNERNISLINEFTYNLFLSILEYHEELFAEEDILNSYHKDDFDYIWEKLFLWVNWWDNELINADIIKNAITLSANCQNLNDVCYREFREKYNPLPHLAYTVWNSLNTDSQLVEALLIFYDKLPPLMSLNNFTFRYVEANRQDPSYYWWSFSINIYWKNISNDEVTEIQWFLWTQCIWSTNLTHTRWIDLVNEVVDKYSQGDLFLDSSMLRDLQELKEIFTEIWRNFNGLSNFNKAKRYFEIYRMLRDANLCTVELEMTEEE